MRAAQSSWARRCTSKEGALVCVPSQKWLHEKATQLHWKVRRHDSVTSWCPLGRRLGAPVVLTKAVRLDVLKPTCRWGAGPASVEM
eukprot:scaffold453_cov258-Prasinococcus_capsulatus_cf.AAC.1